MWALHWDVRAMEKPSDHAPIWAEFKQESEMDMANWQNYRSTVNGMPAVFTANIEDVENDFTVLIKSPQAALLHSNHFNADDIVSLYGSETTFGYIDPLGTLCLVNKPNNEPIAL